ncbi:hypothetical protein NPIL_575291, partial [Nephila pilipes]
MIQWRIVAMVPPQKPQCFSHTINPAFENDPCRASFLPLWRRTDGCHTLILLLGGEF